MINNKKEILRLVKIGKELIIGGQYNNAHDFYDKALEYEPENYIARKGLGELMFIDKEYLAAADNFYIAAVDESYQINLDMLLNEKNTDPEQILRKREEIREATLLLEGYSKKAGLALFAYQHDNPLEKNARQAAINIYRNEIDPCGYSGYTDANKDTLVKIEKEVEAVGYRFFKMMNKKTKEDSQDSSPLEIIIQYLPI